MRSPSGSLASSCCMALGLSLLCLLAVGCGQSSSQSPKDSPVAKVPSADANSPEADPSAQANQQDPTSESDPQPAKQPASTPDDKPSVTEKPVPKEPADDSPAQADPKEPEKKEPPVDEEPVDEDIEKKDPADENPFPRRTPAPSFDGGLAWINTSGPLDTKDLKGKFVLLDFWTYCCINCMHILPELKKLEHAYPNELVVIGVHSAKFENEKDTANIREAVLRYEIEHPVINDANHVVWNKFGVQSWPSIRIIDPEGNVVAGHSGEITFPDLDAFLKGALPYYRKKGTLDETPLHFAQEADKAKKTPLRFPGKVLADEPGKRLFISDSNHNRIVITDLDGKLLDTIGSGAIGREDGNFKTASFDHPQGTVLSKNILYVADTENHMLRKIDLEKKQVTTIAGTGVQARGGWPGMEQMRNDPLAKVPDRWVGLPSKTALNSPWALWVHKEDLYIAMAGPHQIWKMPLDESEIGPFAGNGREDIVDGPLLPRTPYEQGYSSFAQPSGLASDGKHLFVADSEGSSIRAVPFDTKKEVTTIVGTAGLPFARLFLFGDRDGKGLQEVDVPAQNFQGKVDEIKGVVLQHALGVVYYQDKLYVADTYNNKIKVIDVAEKSCETVAGNGKPGLDDAAPTFDEPAGITAAAGKLYVADTNNHAIRVIDLSAGNKVSTLTIEGLTAPVPPAAKQAKPSFPRAKQIQLEAVSVRPTDGKITLKVSLELADGWKINTQAPQRYLVEVEGADGPIDRTAVGKLVKLDEPSASFEVSLPVKADSGDETLKFSLSYFHCLDGAEGLCKTGSATWTVPLKIADDAKEKLVNLVHQVK